MARIDYGEKLLMSKPPHTSKQHDKGGYGKGTYAEEWKGKGKKGMVGLVAFMLGVLGSGS